MPYIQSKRISMRGRVAPAYIVRAMAVRIGRLSTTAYRAASCMSMPCTQLGRIYMWGHLSAYIVRAIAGRVGLLSTMDCRAMVQLSVPCTQSGRISMQGRLAASIVLAMADRIGVRLTLELMLQMSYAYSLRIIHCLPERRV